MHSKTWFGLVGRAGQIILGFLSFLLAAWAFLLRLDEEPALAHTTALAAGALVWSFVVVCLLERRPSATLGPTGEPHRVFRFQGRARLGLISVAIALPVLLVGIPHLRGASQSDSDATLILVATFDGPDDKYGVTEAIIEELRRLERSDPQLRVRSVGVKISPKDGPSAAQKIAEDSGAAVIVWGWYRATEKGVALNAHYQVVRDSCASYFGPPVRRIVADVRDLSCFTVQTQVASEMAILASISGGLAHYSRNRDIEAGRYFRDAFAASRDAPEFLDDRTRAWVAHLAAHNAWLTRQYDSAGTYFDSAIALNPSYWRSYIGRGGVYADQKDFASAVRFLDRAVEISGNNPEALGGRGEVHRRAGHHSLAKDDLDLALRLRPDLWWLFNESGKLAAATGDHHAAAMHFTRALDLIGEDVTCRRQLYNERGNARFAMYERDRRNGKEYLSAAATDFSAALQISPSYAVARYNRGLVYSRLGYVRRAYSDYSEHIELNPGDYRTRIERGRLLLENLSRPAESIADFDAAISSDPQRPDAYYLRGVALVQLGATTRAIQDFQHVQRMRSDDEWAHSATEWVKRLNSRN